MLCKCFLKKVSNALPTPRLTFGILIIHLTNPPATITKYIVTAAKQLFFALIKNKKNILNYFIYLYTFYDILFFLYLHITFWPTSSLFSQMNPL